MGMVPCVVGGLGSARRHIALVLGASALLRDERAVLLITVIATALLVAVATVKGTSPGGPKRLAQYRMLTEDRERALQARRRTRDEPDLSEVLENLKASRRPE